ncbi:hypothetical protein NP493_92g07013 [Ridgeia piscesae]|uniref:Sushi domain-containing protein n=1 Tax=Ridgeia piscesae TaxID=27915 RepID=A0AAD9P8A8_RIDPI|nr:hypothetical protein NP493_92g07013 [Ridgeia piscesae]
MSALSNATHCPPVVGQALLVSTTERSVGTVITLTCEDGFRLTGVERITCHSGGFWSSDFPVCDTAVATTSTVWIIVVCSIATLMALAVVVCAVYMLCMSFGDQKKNPDKIREMRNDKIRMYLAETQNYVWSPGDVEDVCPHTGQDQVDADGDDDDTASITSASGTTETTNGMSTRVSA